MADYADLLAAETKKKPEKGSPSPVERPTGENHPSSQPVQKTRPKEALDDVTASKRHDVNHRAWRDLIENTETHSSALRLTREERYEVEDMIQELERKHKIKTSMNEVARLGILFIIHDYKERRQESLVYKVKKS